MIRRLIATSLLVACGLATLAAEPPPKFFTCPVDQLEIVEGKLLSPRYGNTVVHGDVVDVLPERWVKPGPLQVRLDGSGAVELVVESGSGGLNWKHVFLAVRTEGKKPVTGSFVFWKGDQRQVVRWRLPAGANTTRAEDWFNYGRAARLDRTARQHLGEENIPGTAWFRHQLDEVAGLKTAALSPLWRAKPDGLRPDFDPKPEPMEPRAGWVTPLNIGDGGPTQRGFAGDRGDFLQLLSGGRAISENLQLKRELNVRGDKTDRPTVKISELKGIEVKEFDWGPLIVGLRPRVDPLAAVVPADQHAVFFPDVPAAIAILEELDRTGLAAMNLAEARGTDARLADRYMKQLGLPSAQLGKLLPESLIDNVAITGSDLYFDTGTDLAVLLSTSRPALVRQLVTAAWPVLKAMNRDAIDKEEVIAGTQCRVLRTPDRRICCYVTAIGDAVLLANSPAQVRRIVDTKAGRTPPLAGSPEYTFFRDRYRRGEASDGGFAILTDAAIRRWCSPVWRIGHQRRLQTGAYLSDAHTVHLQTMRSAGVRKVDDSRLGPIEVGPHGIHSAAHGSRLFQTPIAEAEIETVTAAEADAYRRWRDSYQLNWSQFFDPIAIQIAAGPNKLTVDMTVIPLILGTDYRELVGLTTGARLPPGSGDPHPEALAQFVMGFNRKDPTFAKTIARYEGMVGQQFDIAGWIGDWATIYADEDPAWDEFVKSELTESEFWGKRRWAFPVALGISVRDSKKHALFVEKLRDLINAFFPLEWTEVTHKGVSYASIRQKSEEAGPRLYSLILPEQWVLSPNETAIRRAIDRHLARKDGRPASEPVWLGDSLGFTAKPKAAEYLRDWWGRSGLSSVQRAAWANIPILNEWRQLDSRTDPVAFHERWWGERLLEPAGGKYVWNPDDGTMESTLLGHPGRPKGTRATVPATLAGLRGADFGVTFEKDGLRARIELQR